MDEIGMLIHSAWDGLRPVLETLAKQIQIHPVETVLFVAAGIWALQASGAIGSRG